MSYLITWLQQSKMTKGIYKNCEKILRKRDFTIQSLKVIKCVKEDNEKIRVNLVLPTFNKYKVFGGIATALQVYEHLADSLNADMRIIISKDEKFNKKYSVLKKDYKYNQHTGEKIIVFLSDIDDVLSVRKNDVFICTSWDTAYCIESVIEWKKNQYDEKIAKMIYLIQDFEPGFYPWSTEYILADSTYKNDKIDVIALFNSKELFDFFELRKYHFYKKYYFKPNLNEKMACYLQEQKEIKRKKQILVYGRPRTKRNAFEIIVHALRLWVTEMKNVNEWEIISLGETFDDINIGKNLKIKCLGKATLEEYGKIMLESYVGISLMASPHPSYPPLEMSAFGVKVITNQFENKNLEDFSPNIISLNKCTPEAISEQLVSLCTKYPEQIAKVEKETSYITDHSSMIEAIEVIASEFRI